MVCIRLCTQFDCRVKVPQKRRCVKKKLGTRIPEDLSVITRLLSVVLYSNKTSLITGWMFWKGCQTTCGAWQDMPKKVFKNGKWRYPLFEGRQFDAGKRFECTPERSRGFSQHRDTLLLTCSLQGRTDGEAGPGREEGERTSFTTVHRLFLN